MPYAPDLAGCALYGRYELHELIGEGTFGRVYRGYDRRLARPIAAHREYCVLNALLIARAISANDMPMAKYFRNASECAGAQFEGSML